uniref:Uncharacterized protein n=1 Tax=Arundo donax TaxID=35708 RepID=A0A0A9EWN5_ARUDO
MNYCSMSFCCYFDLVETAFYFMLAISYSGTGTSHSTENRGCC